MLKYPLIIINDIFYIKLTLSMNIFYLIKKN